jgi:hypothetical protein
VAIMTTRATAAKAMEPINRSCGSRPTVPLAR